MRFPTFIRAFGALTIVLAATTVFATEQACDTITFAGQQHSILERPLDNFLRRLPKIPVFDAPNTANWKGYTASWEVKDSRLYLATFHATTNHQPYSVSVLFPRRKLPIHADWYSGTVHIIGGKAWAQGYDTYERVTALQVTNGWVVATNNMTNIREAKIGR